MPGVDSRGEHQPHAPRVRANASAGHPATAEADSSKHEEADGTSGRGGVRAFRSGAIAAAPSLLVTLLALPENRSGDARFSVALLVLLVAVPILVFAFFGLQDGAAAVKASQREGLRASERALAIVGIVLAAVALVTLTVCAVAIFSGALLPSYVG
jgi:hypothetical protein